MIYIVNNINLEVTDKEDLKLIRDYVHAINRASNISMDEVRDLGYKVWCKFKHQIHCSYVNDNPWYDKSIKVLEAWTKLTDNPHYWVKKMNADTLWICFKGRITEYSLSRRTVSNEIDIGWLRNDYVHTPHDLWVKVRMLSGLKRIDHAYEPYLMENLFTSEVLKIIDNTKNSDDLTEQYLGSRESCEDKDAYDDFNKAISEEEDED